MERHLKIENEMGLTGKQDIREKDKERKKIIREILNKHKVKQIFMCRMLSTSPGPEITNSGDMSLVFPVEASIFFPTTCPKSKKFSSILTLDS